MARGDRDLVESALRNARGQYGRRIRVPCPFCGPGKKDHKASLSVESATGLYFCWRCGTGGKLRDAPNPGDFEEPPAGPMLPPEGYISLAAGDGAEALSLEPARWYLHRRGVTPSMVAELEIGAAMEGRYRGRVLVPIKTDDVWYGWSARDWTGTAKLPYLYPPGMRRILFNGDALTADDDRPILVVEGVFDAIWLWPHGVAVLGMPSAEQYLALVDTRRPVAIVLDGDAWDKGQMLAVKLQLDGQRAGSVKLPPKLDPDEIPQDVLLSAAARCIGNYEPVEV